MKMMNIFEFPVELNHYNIKEQIGEGVTGIVYKAYDTKNEKDVAIKIIYEKDCFNDNYDFRELFAPNILKLSGISTLLGFRFPLITEESENIALPKFSIKSKDGQKHKIRFSNAIIVTEYMPNGSIKRYIKDYLKSNGTSHEKMNPTIRNKIIFGIASTMKRVHSHKITHRDLKLENIFLDEKLEPKIADFGMANINEGKVNKSNPPLRINGPLEFDTQLFVNQSEKYEEDVYSFAFLLYRMFANKILFEGKKQPKSPVQFMMKIGSGERPVRPDGVSDSFWELIEMCWNKDASKRPTFCEITEMLKDDRFLLNEFGMSASADDVHEYQKRIESEEVEKEKPKILDIRTTFDFEEE